jgi:hypothetical protein
MLACTSKLDRFSWHMYMESTLHVNMMHAQIINMLHIPQSKHQFKHVKRYMHAHSMKTHHEHMCPWYSRTYKIESTHLNKHSSAHMFHVHDHVQQPQKFETFTSRLFCFFSFDSSLCVSMSLLFLLVCSYSWSQLGMCKYARGAFWMLHSAIHTLTWHKLLIIRTCMHIHV